MFLKQIFAREVAEDFVVLYVGPAILKVIDPNQFGAIPKLSTAQALISMVHEWAKATDGTGAAVLSCATGLQESI